MENNKNKKSVKFQGDMLNFCDFIQVFVFTRNHHLKTKIGISELISWTKLLHFSCKQVTALPKEKMSVKLAFFSTVLKQ